ncbi:MAG: hypothetical protein PHX38_06570 [Sulfuricella sp.]|nr:hypothetical protein [Sulfuricella sp.]
MSLYPVTLKGIWLMKNERSILQIPFYFRGLPSCFHIDGKTAESLKQQFADRLEAWVQNQADAIVAEEPGVSWLDLHRKLKSRLTKQNAPSNSLAAAFRGKSALASERVPQYLLNSML